MQNQTSVVNLPTLELARSFFEFDDDDKLIFNHTFLSLGTSILTRWAIAKNSSSSENETLIRDQRLIELFRHTNSRIFDLFFRITLIDWLRRALPDSLTEPGWYSAGSLSIKDFHGDVSALMDSITPVLLEALDLLKNKDRLKLPGFADIQDGTRRSFRTSFESDLQSLIDRTDDWWKPVKRIRDLVMHRDHQKLVFGGPPDKVLFQVYEGHLEPAIGHQNFLWADNQNVVDFKLYSGFVVAEILVFLDEIGKFLSDKLGIPVEEQQRTRMSGHLTSFVASLDYLIDTVKQSTDKTDSPARRTS